MRICIGMWTMGRRMEWIRRDNVVDAKLSLGLLTGGPTYPKHRPVQSTGRGFTAAIDPYVVFICGGVLSITQRVLVSQLPTLPEFRSHTQGTRVHHLMVLALDDEQPGLMEPSFYTSRFTFCVSNERSLFRAAGVYQ